MMPSLGTAELALAILCAEFALASVLVPAFLLHRMRRQAHVAEAAAQARAAGAVEEVLKEVSEAEPARREALATIFASTYDLAEEEVAERVEEFIAREQAFYQVMTQVYLERDEAGLKALPEELTKVVSPWIRMTPSNMVAATEVAALNASNDALEQSNTALNAALEETRRSMDELMGEYMKAFHAQGDAALPAAAVAAVSPSVVDEDDLRIDAAEAAFAADPVTQDESGVAEMAPGTEMASGTADVDIDIDGLDGAAGEESPLAGETVIDVSGDDDAVAPPAASGAGDADLLTDDELESLFADELATLDAPEPGGERGAAAA